MLRLRQFDSTEHAAKSFAALQKTMKTCTTDTMDGSKLTYSVLSMPDMEDGSLAVGTTADQGIGLPQFFTLVGPTLISVGGGGLMSANADSYLDVLKKQIAAYKAAAS